MMTHFGRTAAAFAVAGFLLLAACGDDDERTSTTDSSTSATATSSTGLSTSAAGTSITSPGATASTATSTTVGPTLAAVGFVDAGPGGGSGEIVVQWEGVDGATGYRVQRSDAEGGQFVVSADVNVATGEEELGDGVTDIWSPPAGTPPFTIVAGVEPPPRFEYIEVVGAGVTQRWFRVIAYGPDGEGPASATVCGTPNGVPDC